MLSQKLKLLVLAPVCMVFILGLSMCGSNPGKTSTSTETPQTPDFSISMTPASITVAQGESQVLSFKIAATNGFTDTVNFTIGGLPTGVTATPATLSAVPGTTQSITIAASATATAGKTTLTFTGKTATLSHQVSVDLTVSPSPDFTLSVSPASVSLISGGSAQAVTLAASTANGFSGTVNVAMTGLPAGVTAQPSTVSLVPGTPQTVSLQAAAGTQSANATVIFTGSHGALAHQASLALRVTLPAAADFSIVLQPSSPVSLTGGASAQTVSVTAVPVSGFNDPVSVAISGLPAGVAVSPVTLTLTPGTAENVSLTAGLNAASGNSSIAFAGTSGSRTHTSTLAINVTAAPTPDTSSDVTTYHNDNSRSGLNANEKTLTPANVKSATFGKIGFYNVDGKVDAEPLYVSSLLINGTAHDVLYVETEHGSVYAFDASSGAILWQTTILTAGEIPSDDRSSANISPEIGITATPVIDRKLGMNGAIFVVGMSKDTNDAYHQRLHALDLTTGAELEGGPTEIQATFPGTGASSSKGVQTFAPGQYAERAALLLLNGAVYTAWSSHGDIKPYTGWVIGYDETTLKQSSVLNVTPNGHNGQGGIWQSGAGPAADSNGNIYFIDGNGDFDTTLDANNMPSKGDYGNTFLKVSTANGSLAPADYFATYTTVSDSQADTDFGSGGALLIPDIADSTGAVHHLAVGAGKDGSIYVVDRDNMGKFNSTANTVYQQLEHVISAEFGMPAYFNNTVYICGLKQTLRAFTFTSDAKLGATPSSHSANTFGYPGATPGISANGTQNGIVWALQSSEQQTAVLYAFDASNLAKELYDSTQAGDRDSFGDGNKYLTPLVTNGKVYVGTPNGVAVFGLLKSQ